MTTTEQSAADLKKNMADLNTEATTTPEEKTVPAKKKSPAKKKAKSAKANGSAENRVTLKDLAKDHKMATRVARRKLRLAGLEPDGRWTWEKGSAALKKAEAALSATK